MPDTHPGEGVTTVDRDGGEQRLLGQRCHSPVSPQDLAWMLSFYVRVFLTYMPLLGLKGFLGLFFIVR